MFIRVSTLAAVLMALTSTAYAVPYQVLEIDGPSWVEVEQVTGDLQCRSAGGPIQTLHPATHATLGPGDGWGAVTLGPTVKVFTQAACDTGAGPSIDVPATDITWMSWRLLPRASDGTVYAPTRTHLVAIELDPPALREVVAWSDVATFLGVELSAGQQAWDALRFNHAVALPSGELWLLRSTLGELTQVIAIAPDGQLRRVAEMPAPGSDIRGAIAMAWADTIEAVVIGRQHLSVPNPGEALWRVTFLPTTVPFNPTSPPTVHERHLPEWVTTLPVESGMPLFGVEGPVEADTLLALDLDSDGLLAEDETRLGTSPWSADSDGDGALDGAEDLLFGTDPTDPASVIAASPAQDFAPSTLINDWVTLAHPETYSPFVFYMTSDLRHNHSGTGVVCVADTCYHEEGVALSPKLPDDRDELALMLSGAGYVAPGGGGIRRTTFGQANTDEVSVEIPDAAQTIAVTGDEVYFRANTRNGLEIHRYIEGESLVVVDADRFGCPIVATQAELDSCGDAPPPAGRTEVAWAGYDTTRKALIVLAGNDTEWWLSAVTTRGQTRILTPGDLGFANLLEAEFVPLSNGQALLRTKPRVPNTHTARPGVMALDERLRPQATAWPLAADFRGGPTLGEGVFSPLTVSYPIYDDGGHGGPVCFDEVCVPERPGGPNIVQYLHTSLGVLWVPRTKTPVAGEAILAVRPRGTSADGGLWRLGPRGEIGPWLGPDAFAALSGGAFGDIESSAIAAIGSDADGRRLCLITTVRISATEGDSVARVWELSLGADGSPIALTQVAADVTGPVACTYGSDGALAVLAEAPSRLVRGTTTIVLPDLDAPRGLFAFGARFVAVGARDDAQCIDATTGAIRGTGERLAALSRGPGNTIATVDAAGKGALIDLTALCTGDSRINLEDFIRGVGSSLWDLGNEGNPPKPGGPVPSAPRAAIAHTDKGMAYVVGLGETLRPQADDPQASDEGAWSLMTGRLLRVRPAYAPTDWQDCLAAVDPFRRDEVKVRLAAPRAQVTAMTVLGDRTLVADGEDWEYRGMTHEPRPCAPPVGPEPEPEPEPEVVEPAPEPAPRRNDDGCGAADPAFAACLALLMLAGLVRLRRARTTGR